MKMNTKNGATSSKPVWFLWRLWQCAGWVDEYLGRTEKAQERYKKAGAVFDFARTLNAVGAHLEARTALSL